MPKPRSAAAGAGASPAGEVVERNLDGAAQLQPRPSVIFFDVNETLPDITPLAARFADVAAPGLLANVRQG
jgi:hypothetical protein